MINLCAASNKTRSLRALNDHIEQNLRSLEALKQDINQNVFISIVTSKYQKMFSYNLNYKRVQSVNGELFNES